MRSPLPPSCDPVDVSGLYEIHPSLESVELACDARLAARSQIVSMMPKNAVAAELGVFTGVFSEFLLHQTKPRVFYMVDPWNLQYGEFFPNWGPYTDNGSLETSAALAAARRRAAHFEGAEIVVTHGYKWIKNLPDNHLDWIYLDSSHTYPDTMNELTLLSSKMKKDGIIFGDDCWTDPGGVHFGVFRAITAFCRSHPFELFRLDHAAQWAVRRRSDIKS